MVAQRTAPLPPPRPRRVRPLLLTAVALAVLVLVPLPVGANHVQNVVVDGATYTVEFDHAGDNEWWVEFEARAGNGDSLFIGWAQVEGSSTWHYMQFAANSYERQQQGWSKFEPDQNFQVPPGKRVRFAVGMTDGSSDAFANQVVSCWFTHPAGGEQCDLAPPSTTFDPPFTGFRGNEWWVQANVGTGECISKVDVRSNGGAWMPLKKQSWSPTAWAGSYHFPQGSVLQMRATACDGRTDLSSCRQWIPPANTDATIVPCSGGTTAPFDATFSGVKGNEWWVQTSVSANQPVQEVAFRIDCSEEWRSLKKQSYGWAGSFHVPAGSKVDFRATSTTGNSDFSGGYLWPQATPTSSC
jgi:hypothetical protein